MRSGKHLIRTVATVAICVTAGIAAPRLFAGSVSPVAAGAVIGALGILCLVGVGLGIREAREAEARRKRKQQIWLEQ